MCAGFMPFQQINSYPTYILGREAFGERVLSLIFELSRNKKNCTFAIDGEWGSGETFVLEMIENKLEDIQSEKSADNKYMVFHYNCWEYEDEPLIAIVSAMLEKAENENKIFITLGKIAKAGWNKAFKELKSIAGEIVKNKIGVDPIQFGMI